MNLSVKSIADPRGQINPQNTRPKSIVIIVIINAPGRTVKITFLDAIEINSATSGLSCKKISVGNR